MINEINVPSLNAALFAAADFCKDCDCVVDVVVPDKLSLFMERFLFKQLNLTASFSLRVSTLNRFAKRNLDVDKSRQISKVGGILLVHKILNENAQNFCVLKSFNYTFSYAENVYRTIGQLKASKISPEEMSKFTSTNKQLEGKILDLAKIYAEYERQKAGLLDASDMFLLSSVNIANTKQNSKILFVGFDDFTAIEYSIIEQLATTNEVNIFVYKSSAGNKHIYNSELEQQLKNIAYNCNIGFKQIDKTAKPNDLVGFLQNNLFSTEHGEFCLNNQTVKVYSANSVKQELELVARDIRQKVLDGKSFDSFGVAVFGLDGKVDKVEEIFNKYDLNFYIDNPLNLAKSVFYKFLLSIFKYNLDTNVVDHLCDIINSPLFVFEEDKKLQMIETLKKFNFVSSLNNFALNENFDQLKKFLSLFDLKNCNVKQCVEKLQNAAQILNFDSILDEISQNADIKSKILLKKSKEIIFNLFDDVVKFYPDADLNVLFDIYSHIVSILSVNNLPATIDAIKVVDADNFVEIFDYLYLVDCTQENAPSTKADCGIILDDEIDALNFKHKLAPTIAHINRLSKLRLFNTALLFNKGLTLSYSKTPSELIKEILSKIKVDINGAKLNLLPEYQITLGGYDALSNWDYIAACYKYKQDTPAGIRQTTQKQFDNLTEKSLKVYDNLKTISASQLESYFKCPFNHFLNNVLKIKPDLDNSIQTFDIGNILHHILYCYYKADKKVENRQNFVKNTIFDYLKSEERLKLNENSPIITNLINEAMRMLDGVDKIDRYSLFMPNKKYIEFKFDNFNLGNIMLMGFVDRADIYNDDNQKFFRIIDYKTRDADVKLKELYYGKKVQLFLYSLAMENILHMPGVGNFYLPLHNNFEREKENSYALDGFFENSVEVVHALDSRLVPNEKSDIVNIKMTKNLVSSQSTNKALSADDFNKLKQYAQKISNGAVDEIRAGFVSPTPLDYKNPCSYCPYKQICLKTSNNIANRITDKVDLSSFDLFSEVEDG